jgi:hypothetical protein
MNWLVARRFSLGLLIFAPVAATAHSFGLAYVLPVPLWIYVYGAVATLVITFALLGYFASAPQRRPVVDGQRACPERVVSPLMSSVVKAGAVGCLLLIIVAGLIGSSDPARNIGPTLFWVVFLLGLAYLTVLVGDVFQLFNPWQRIVDLLEALGLNLSSPRMPYPESLGVWPALLAYMALIWLELFANPPPLAVAVFLLFYSAITFLGVAIFGRRVWFCRADLFNVFFHLVGTLAPVEYCRGKDRASWTVRLRNPFSGALNQRAHHVSLVVFVLFMLSSTTYDSLHDTSLFMSLFWSNSQRLLRLLWGTDATEAQDMLMGWYLFYRQAGLLMIPFVYFGIYMAALKVAQLLAHPKSSLRTLSLHFCFSLIPIAVAYNFAHYFGFLIVQFRSLPSLLSDPFGFGWTLLGIRDISERPVLQAGVIWHVQLAALLGGHVLGVVLAHRLAAQTYGTQRQLILSQIPLLILMVLYTVIGLWTLSLPLLVRGG